MSHQTTRIGAAAGLVAAAAAMAISLGTASCNSSTGPAPAQNVEGQAATDRSDPSVLAAAAAAADRGERLPSRRTQYLPSRDSLVHRQYTIDSSDNRGQQMTRVWQGKVPAGIGDEVWTWQQLYNGRRFQGEALLRSGRVVDGYVLGVMNLGPAEATPGPGAPASTAPSVAPATGPAAAAPPTTRP